MALSMPLHALRIYIHNNNNHNANNNNEEQEDNKTRAYLVQRVTIAIVFVAFGVACAVIVLPENLAKDCGCNMRSANSHETGL